MLSFSFTVHRITLLFIDSLHHTNCVSNVQSLLPMMMTSQQMFNKIVSDLWTMLKWTYNLCLPLDIVPSFRQSISGIPQHSQSSPVQFAPNVVHACAKLVQPQRDLGFWDDKRSRQHDSLGRVQDLVQRLDMKISHHRGYASLRLLRPFAEAR